MICREPIEWFDLWIAGADQAKAQRVLLVGDSIARSYYPSASECLGEAFACARLATSRCVGDPRFIRELGLVLDEYPFDVVHFNNGLHGWGYDEGAYASGLAEALHYLEREAPQSTVLWASTTPLVTAGTPEQRADKDQRVLERNRLAAEICSAKGIPINDLYAFAIDHREYFAPDGVHYNAAGQEALGRRVARFILDHHQGSS